MRKFILAAGIAGMLMCGMGCEKSDVPATNVAVIDMNRLLEDTGQESVIRGKLQAQYSAIITALAAKNPKHMTPQQFDQALQHDPKLEVLRAQINQRMGQMNQELNAQFFTAVQPVIQKVVKDHGITLLVAPTPPVMQYDPATEITDDVLKAINEDTSIFAEGGQAPGAMPNLAPGAPGAPTTAPAATQPEGATARPPAAEPGIEPSRTEPAK